MSEFFSGQSRILVKRLVRFDLNAVSRLDVRESMVSLPAVFQLPLTFLTGKPCAGQRPVHLLPTHHLLAALISLAAGLMISLLSWSRGWMWAPLLLAGWAMTLHAIRNLRMLVFHQCAHRNFYGHSRADQLIGSLVAALLLVQNLGRYSAEHVQDHHSVHHMTLRDPTVQAFMIGLGLRPGMTREAMWRAVLRLLVSPRFHVGFAVARIRSFWSGASALERVAAATFHGGMVVAAGLTGGWAALCVVWFLPLFPFFQVSNTLRLCVKHTFPHPGSGVRRGREYFAGLTNAVFIGEPVPVGAGVTAWVRWIGRMLFVHFPSRYLVLTGDTVVHDYHHRHPISRQWPDYLFARQEDIERGHLGWPSYSEVWGLVPAIDRVFDSLSKADPDEFDVTRVPVVSRRELYAAFDD